jgi:Ca-activated chloride channel family protein
VSFASPAFLLALLLVPALAAALEYARRRSRRYSVRFTGVPELLPIAPVASNLRRYLPLALFLLAMTAAATALARPQKSVDVPVERASVVLVMDASRSMEATDVQPNRLQAARAAGKRFLSRVPRGLRVGMVGFSDSPQTIEALTYDHREVQAALDSLAADGGTATGEALAAALGLFERKDRRGPPAAIVLLSDGKATAGRDPVEVAGTAKRLGIPIFTVALGTDEGVIPGGFGGQPVPPDPETMRRIAAASGGKAFTVRDAGQLDKVYSQLGSQVGTKQEHREITAGFAAGGLVFLLGAMVLSLRWSGRLP